MVFVTYIWFSSLRTDEHELTDIHLALVSHLYIKPDRLNSTVRDWLNSCMIVYGLILRESYEPSNSIYRYQRPKDHPT